MSGYSLSDDSRAIAEMMPIISRKSSIAAAKRTSQSTIQYLGREAHARLDIEGLKIHLAPAPIRRLTHHFVRPDCREEPNHWIGTNTRLRPHLSSDQIRVTAQSRNVFVTFSGQKQWYRFLLCVDKLALFRTLPGWVSFDMEPETE